MTKDETIYRIIKSDREGGFRILLDAYQKPVYYFIRRMVVVHEDAEDVMQETFVKIFLGLNGFRCDSALSTWIYRIGMNESLRFLNKKEIKVVSADNVHDELIDSLKASDYIDYDDKVYNELESKNVEEIKHDAKLLLAGIAKPEPFFGYLQTEKDETLVYPDHHFFTEKDLIEIQNKANNKLIITTEKDYVRLRNSNLKSLFYLPIKSSFVANSDNFDKNITNYVGTSTRNR